MNDSLTLVKMKIDWKAEIFSFNRQDVIIALMEQVASAARVFGPFSTEVEDLEGDIEAVKGGADLKDFTWLFPFYEELVEEA